MRRQPTDAEQKLWLLLRNRRFVNFKFRRQVPIDHYIADFLCFEARLIIELDGSQHVESTYDASRDTYLVPRASASSASGTSTSCLTLTQRWTPSGTHCRSPLHDRPR